MKINKYVLPLSILNLIAIVIVTLGLPDIVPLHISFTGSVNYSGPKWFIPLIALIPTLILIIYNFKDEWYGKSLENKEITNKLIPILSLFLMIVPWFLVIIALGDSASLNRSVAIAISILLALIFIIIGYYLSSPIKQNRFIGIRTPWTLKNKEVWRKTNKLGSYFFVAGGLFALISSIAAFITSNTNYLLISWIIAIFLVIVPVFYSYYTYSKIEK